MQSLPNLSGDFFAEIQNPILKIHLESQGTLNSHNNPKKNKAGDSQFQNLLQSYSNQNSADQFMTMI